MPAGTVSGVPTTVQASALVEEEEDAVVEAAAEIVDRRRQLPRAAGPEVDEGLLERGEEPARLLVGIGGEDVERRA